MQLNHFAKTQLDSHSGLPIFVERIWKATGWSPIDMRDKWVLDVGCGSGRFAEIALSSGAQVVALDYSSAVVAGLANLKHHLNLHVDQGDIFSFPFVPGSFDFVYFLGILQHTSDVARAFAALPPMLVVGGHLCTDFYLKRLQTMIHMKYLLRPLTMKINHQKLCAYFEKAVPIMLPISQALRRVPLIGKVLQRFIPVADYSQIYHLTEQQSKESALLDTVNWLAPRYDYPQTQKEVKRLFSNAGFTDIEIFHAGHLVGRSVKEYSELTQ